ncbi:hypothetical protein [Clostridium neonatale]|uniref:hypothetical protein n=1 Tax=Clostridium neonatale TaxID=137838 RepID=UPI00291C1972|nr:hypothetical protein CNEO4_240087 [Clostridium neonatale]
MKNLLKEAHKLTKEIKNKYPEVDYKAQLGVCISYLNNKGEDKMVELKGTEKQIDWAEEIRKNIIEMFDKKIEKMNDENVKNSEVYNELVRNRKNFRNKVKTTAEARKEYASILEEIKEAILDKDNAQYYIDQVRSYDLETLMENYFSTEFNTIFPEHFNK